MTIKTLKLPMGIGAVLFVLQASFINNAAAAPSVNFAPAPGGSVPQSSQPTPDLQAFKNVGVVRRVDGAERTIIISGNKYYYGIDIKVHRTGTNFSTVNSLTKETLIGFNDYRDEQGRRFLEEIWVLPRNALIPAPTDR